MVSGTLHTKCNCSLSEGVPNGKRLGKPKATGRRWKYNKITSRRKRKSGRIANSSGTLHGICSLSENWKDCSENAPRILPRFNVWKRSCALYPYFSRYHLQVPFGMYFTWKVDLLRYHIPHRQNQRYQK